MHPDYTEDGSSGYPNDIALILLSYPVEFNSQTKAISLPSDNINESFAECSITGWGCTEKRNQMCTSTPDNLQGTPMDVMTKSDCDSIWSSVKISDYHICVNNTNAGGCNGDSGGPLSCMQNGVKVLAGATSWGSSTCSTSLPSVYARVSEFVGWIKGVTQIA